MAKFKPERRKCKNCGKEYTAIRSWAKFCSDTCRIANYRKSHPQLSPEELKQIKERLGIDI